MAIDWNQDMLNTLTKFWGPQNARAGSFGGSGGGGGNNIYGGGRGGGNGFSPASPQGGGGQFNPYAMSPEDRMRRLGATGIQMQRPGFRWSELNPYDYMRVRTYFPDIFGDNQRR